MLITMEKVVDFDESVHANPPAEQLGQFGTPAHTLYLDDIYGNDDDNESGDSGRRKRVSRNERRRANQAKKAAREAAEAEANVGEDEKEENEEDEEEEEEWAETARAEETKWSISRICFKKFIENGFTPSLQAVCSW